MVTFNTVAVNLQRRLISVSLKLAIVQAGIGLEPHIKAENTAESRIA